MGTTIYTFFLILFSVLTMDELYFPTFFEKISTIIEPKFEDRNEMAIQSISERILGFETLI